MDVRDVLIYLDFILVAKSREKNREIVGRNREKTEIGRLKTMTACAFLLAS